MLFTFLNLPDIKGMALFCGLERVPINWFPSTPLLLTSARFQNKKAQGQHRDINRPKQNKFVCRRLFWFSLD
jgi:hypothetical protein